MNRYAALALACLVTADVSAQAQGTREVTVDTRSVVPVATRLRFTTMIILPENEEILDFVCGDKDHWVISGTHNLAYVKPAKAAAATNLNLVTSSGAVYSFLLTEGAAQPDLKLYVNSDRSREDASRPKFHSPAEVEELRRTIDDLRSQAQDAREAAARAVEDIAEARLAAARQADDEVSAFRTAYPLGLRFPYLFKSNQDPFNVTAIFHDGRFTYIHAEATELPSLYELRDESPNLIAFQVENGVYVVPKVMESGYLAIGRKKLSFALREK